MVRFKLRPVVLTFLHAFLRVPNGQPVTIQVLLSLPVNFKVHLHLPVLQMAGLKHNRSNKLQKYKLKVFGRPSPVPQSGFLLST